jgi:hypothetical protein
MVKYPKDFQKVVDFLKSYDVNVMIDCVTYYIKTEDEQSICIHHNYDLEKNGLIALLHEAGHVLQSNNNGVWNHYKDIDDMEKPKEYNMYQFMNELDAWNRGEELIELLDLNVNPKRFHKQREEALLSYYV